MKKGLLIVIATILLFGFTNVSAMSKSDLEKKLTKAYTINGTTFQASDSDITKIKRYIKQNDISESDADYISKKVDEAIDVIEDSGVKSLNDLSKKYREKLVSICNDVSEHTAIKVTASKKSITIYNMDGTVFDEFDSEVVKKTGTTNIILITSVVSLLGVAFITRKQF